MDSDAGKNKVPRKVEEPAPPGTEIPLPLENPTTPVSTPKTAKVVPSSKGVENAKKRLRAFSIQKKTPITPIIVPKATGSGNTTVLIGKLSSVKVTPKVEDPEQKKQPKPPKPGTTRKSFQDSYTDLQKRTLAEIEDMKRKMELVELGIPLGLICPTSTSEKAMPTKAMPPIKSFLDPAKVDELIREAKKAKQEGREFKFNYQKLLPDYDNPFQRRREESFSYEKDRKSDRRKSETEKDKDKDRRKSDKYDSKRHEYRKDDIKYKERDRDKVKDKSRSKEEKNDDKKIDKPADKEADVNLNDYLVCDSWSLDNDDKNSNSSPKPQEKPSNFVATFTPASDNKVTEPSEQLKASLSKKKEMLRNIAFDNPVNVPAKIEKLQPVIDSFKFEIDPNDDEILDIFDEESSLEKYAQQTKSKKQSGLYGSPDKSIDYGADVSKDTSLDGLNDDTFLESVINEIKQEDLSDDNSQDKGLVEYDISPNREDESPLQKKRKSGSATPEIVDKTRTQSQRSDYSEGYRSSDSYKTADTNESGYKSVESYRISVEKELDAALEAKMSKSTVDSLETWSFVLKICQPLLFRHDKNKCYKETRTTPKIWYTENPKGCSCVKDRSVVYEELEMCKMNLVDRVYGCDQIPDSPFSTVRNWYPRNSLCSTENPSLPLSNEWEAEDSLQARTEERRSETPQRNDELSLDREYQRFMEAVWPDVVDTKVETSRSTTPVKQKEDSRKKKKDDIDKEADDKKAKKIKLSSEGWSQESDLDEEQDKSKMKVEKEKTKTRKRKHSSSTISSSLSDSDEASVKKRKLLKKKALKKTKSKSAKRRRMGRKLLKKLKEKQNKRSKQKESDDDSDKKKEKKIKKKKQEKLKKKAQKKKKARVQTSSSSSSSSDSSSSDSESDRKSKKAKKRNQERKKKVKKQRKQSSSDSTQSEDLFDVNILNNIKTERLTDDEKGQKLMEFSPRRQKPREIINVKELQNDFVENIHIKQEVEDVPKEPKDTKQSDFDRSAEQVMEVTKEEIELPEEPPPPPLPAAPAPAPVAAPAPPAPDESNMSQCSSQESVCSVKDVPSYEKDESHLRPSSQNSNYSFNDVISASQSALYQKGIESVSECEDKYAENYETANYEMYEQLAMAYQSDVASQRASPPGADSEGSAERRIETVVRARCGEIKCDWRAGHSPAPATRRPHRPSRWGLKPGEVNIVLTGEGTHFPVEEAQPIYQIQSIANRTDSNVNTGYDEAYMDTYGASDRLQYGDCFAPDFDSNAIVTNSVSANIAVTAIDNITENTTVTTVANNVETRTTSLDDRINQALRETVLGEVAKEVEAVDADKDVPEKGILITNITTEPRGSKRVSFADGYKPGQDSDVEEPPVKKRKKSRRYGCAWPCPAAHPDHVPLWDALPPPPPPPGSPPPPPRPAPPAHLLRAARRPPHPGLPQPHHPGLPAPHHPGMPAPPLGKFDPSIPLPGFMPPEPPPGLITLQ